MNPDFIDLLRALCAAEARLLVVGAYAVSFHSEPRSTGSFDLWVEATVENAGRVHRALAEFGAPLQDLAVEDLAIKGIVYQIGIAPRRIDILTSIDGVEFAQAWSHRVSAKYGEVGLSLIGIDDLIRNKTAVGRPKDLLDIETLKRYRR